MGSWSYNYSKQRWFHVSPKMGEGIPSPHDAFHPEVPVGKSSNDRDFLPCLMMSKGCHIPFIITIKMSVKFHKSKIHPIEIQIQFKHYLESQCLEDNLFLLWLRFISGFLLKIASTPTAKHVCFFLANMISSTSWCLLLSEVGLEVGQLGFMVDRSILTWAKRPLYSARGTM